MFLLKNGVKKSKIEKLIFFGNGKYNFIAFSQNRNESAERDLVKVRAQNFA